MSATPPGDPVSPVDAIYRLISAALILGHTDNPEVADAKEKAITENKEIILAALQAVQPSPLAPRLWWCPVCCAKRKATEAQGDLVCDTCALVIASYFEGEPEALPKEGA